MSHPLLYFFWRSGTTVFLRGFVTFSDYFCKVRFKEVPKTALNSRESLLAGELAACVFSRTTGSRGAIGPSVAQMLANVRKPVEPDRRRRRES